MKEIKQEIEGRDKTEFKQSQKQTKRRKIVIVTGLKVDIVDENILRG